MLTKQEIKDLNPEVIENIKSKGKDVDVQVQQYIDSMRAERDAILQATDWTQVVDNGLTEAEKGAWRAYREQLRNLPQTRINPMKPVFPKPPFERNELERFNYLFDEDV